MSARVFCLLLMSSFLLTSPMRGAGELPSQAVYLQGLTVCLDPGHGGDIGEHYDRTQYKRGPTGLREAVVNLRLSNELAALLRRAGATVLLTREADVEVSLADRVALANDHCADLFLSVHHNTSTRESANFTSMWHHGDGSSRPASLDVARYLGDAYIRNMGTSEPQFSGVYSDLLMYENGFHVLRETRMPAVLLECSFLTNLAEEERLRSPEYNRRQAHALFEGLCEWAANGIPRAQLLDAPVPGEPGSFRFRLVDGMKERWGSGTPRVRPRSVGVWLNGAALTFEFVGDQVSFTLEDVPDPALLEISFENRARNASIFPLLDLRTMPCVPVPRLPIIAPDVEFFELPAEE